MTKKKNKRLGVAEFVVRDCPILGKEIVKHYINK